jgi:hypothetical protein
MTYFADLTQYEFLDSDHGAKNFLNIGWIDRAYPYPKGPTPQGVMNRLIEELAQPRNRTRGYHRCNLCCEREPTRFTVGDKDIISISNFPIEYTSLRIWSSTTSMSIRIDLPRSSCKPHSVCGSNETSTWGFLSRLPER